MFCSSSILDRQVLYVNKFGMCLNKALTRFNLVTHQARENTISTLSVLDLNLHQYTVFRIHSRVPELLGIHFSQSLVALKHRDASLLVSVVSRVDVNAFFFAFGYKC